MTNVKPDEFYDGYYGNDQRSISWGKKLDEFAKYFQIVHERYDEAFNYLKTTKKSERTKSLMPDFSDIDNPFFWKIWKSYKIADPFFRFYGEKNNSKDNSIYLSRIQQVLELIEKNLNNLPNVEKFKLFDGSDKFSSLKKDFKMISDVFNDGFLITIQLAFLISAIYNFLGFFIYSNTDDSWYGIYDDSIDEFNLFELEQIFHIKFKFDFNDELVFNIIREEVRWRNVERDINIFKERQKGTLLANISEEFKLDKSTISEITKKVDGAIRYYKGKMFEQKYLTYLKGLGKFDKVEWYGASGQPDIIAHDLKNDELYVYSLKNLKIEEKPYYIPKDVLKPELKISLENHYDYTKVHLILVVFNNIDNTTEEIELDYLNPPSNVVLDD